MVKPSVTPDATRAVLADIADAVRPVERARTAAAVDRVVASAAAPFGDSLMDQMIYEDDDPVRRDEATPDMVDAYENVGLLARCIHAQRRDYAPWVVSPHLFDTRSDPTPSGSNQRRRVTTEQGGE